MRATRPVHTPAHWIGIRKSVNLTDWSWDDLVSLLARHLAIHALFLGSSGSGKTVALTHVIAQAIADKRPVCVIDPLGDLVDLVLALCDGHVLPEQVRLVDLRAGKPSHGFDPLAGTNSAYFKSLNFVSAIEQVSASFGVQIAEYLRHGAMLLASAGQSVTEFERLFFDRAFRLQCLASCTDERLAAFWNRFDQLKLENQAALAMPVLNKLSVLWAAPKLVSVLSHPEPLDISKHINGEGQVLLFAGGLAELQTASKVMTQLFISCLLQEVLERSSIPQSRRRPLLLVTDEFSAFDPTYFEVILAQGRRLGLSVAIGVQTLAQFEAKMRSLVLGCTGTKLIFRLGRSDSKAMSLELTGDATWFDFTRFKTGTCVLARKDEGVIEIEVNEPLLWDLEPHMADVERFSRLAVPNPAVPMSQPLPPLPRDKEAKAIRHGAALENWLCD